MGFTKLLVLKTCDMSSAAMLTPVYKVPPLFIFLPMRKIILSKIMYWFQCILFKKKLTIIILVKVKVYFACPDFIIYMNGFILFLYNLLLYFLANGKTLAFLKMYKT